jgi:hypothetical protein
LISFVVIISPKLEKFFLVIDRKGSGDNLVIENLDKEEIVLKY